MGKEPADIVVEDDHSLAFLDVAPANAGHVLVAPRSHVVDLLAASADEAAAVMRTAHRVAALLEQALHPDGFTLFQANRRAGWQDVFHLHLHIVPRWYGDALVRPWESQVGSLPELKAVAAQLRRVNESGLPDAD